MKKGINAEVLTQPANSPDANLLDLGFYVVQSMNDEVTAGEGEMIEHIQQQMFATKDLLNMAYLYVLFE